MVEIEEADSVVQYQFQARKRLWERWKETIPRKKTLADRINELIEADVEGRVLSNEMLNEHDELERVVDEMLTAYELQDDDELRAAVERAEDLVRGP